MNPWINFEELFKKVLRGGELYKEMGAQKIFFYRDILLY